MRNKVVEFQFELQFAYELKSTMTMTTTTRFRSSTEMRFTCTVPLPSGISESKVTKSKKIYIWGFKSLLSNYGSERLR